MIAYGRGPQALAGGTCKIANSDGGTQLDQAASAGANCHCICSLTRPARACTHGDGGAQLTRSARGGPNRHCVCTLTSLPSAGANVHRRAASLPRAGGDHVPVVHIPAAASALWVPKDVVTVRSAWDEVAGAGRARRTRSPCRSTPTSWTHAAETNPSFSH